MFAQPTEVLVEFLDALFVRLDALFLQSVLEPFPPLLFVALFGFGLEFRGVVGGLVVVGIGVLWAGVEVLAGDGGGGAVRGFDYLGVFV